MDEENKDSKLNEIQETEQTPEAKQDIKAPEENTIVETVQENTVSEPKQEETKKYETFKPVQDAGQKKTKKKGKKGILISLLILIIAVVGICAYYYFGIYTNPQTVYKEAIKDGIKALTATTDEEITTIKSKVKLGLNIELEDNIRYEAGEYVEDILDFINNTEIGIEVQIDKEKQQVVYKLDSTYEDEDLIKINMLLDAKEENAYMELEQFFEKVLKLEIDNVEAYETLRSAFETEALTLAEEATQEKALKIINEEISKIIKPEYCSKEKEKIDIDSEEVSVDAYILKMTGKQLVEELQTVAENLKDNKEYIECFEDEEEVEEQLENMIEALEKIEIEDSSFTMKIYRKGIKQETVRMDFKVKTNDVTVEAQITKTEDGYEFNILQNSTTVISGTVEIEEVDENTNKVDMKINIEEVGKIEIKLETSIITGEKIDTFNTKNAIDMEDITEEELMEAYEKFEESKLYELIEKYFELFTGNSLGNNLNNNSNSSISSSITTTTDNQVVTYSGKTTINYQIPTGYEAEYGSDTYKAFSKDDTRIVVSSFYSDKYTYLEETADSYMDIYQESNYYNNLTKSTEKTVEVDGIIFYYIEISYEYYNEECHHILICTPVNDKEIYTVEVSTVGEFNISDIEDFLKINY